MNRRQFLALLPATTLAQSALALEPKAKRHIVSIGFDDGFKKSSIRTAEIYEKHKLPACLNVIAAGDQPDFVAPDKYQAGIPKGDFALWNELKRRGHEVMPHGYRHENLRQLPLDKAQDSVRRCLDIFSTKLDGFDAKQAIFNCPYNASTPELDAWLPSQVRAFRAGRGWINTWPHRGQTKLTTIGFGPGDAETTLDRAIDNLLAQETGWLVYTAHGLEDEGWGPIRADYLDRLLGRLLSIDCVDILPTGRALAKYAATGQSPAG